MKLRNPITKLITLTIAVTALVCVIGLLQPVKGQTVSYTSLGIVPGQTVRLSVASDERSAGTMSWSFTYYRAPGSDSIYSAPLYQSEWIQVAPGEVRFADVRRNDLHAYGDPITQRVQLIVKVTRVARRAVVRMISLARWKSFPMRSRMETQYKSIQNTDWSSWLRNAPSSSIQSASYLDGF